MLHTAGLTGSNIIWSHAVRTFGHRFDRRTSQAYSFIHCLISKFQIIFVEGQRRYEKKTGQRLDVAVYASIATVADVRSYIARENQQFAAFRSKNGHIYERLNLDFTPIERLSYVVVSGSTAAFPPASPCLGAVALMVKSAQDVSAHYDRTLELFDMLAVRYLLHVRHRG